MQSHPREVENYLTSKGDCPFNDWLCSLKEVKTRGVIRTRIDRLTQGNFGYSGPVGEGVHELKVDYGPGYRIYFAPFGERVILLLGGDKSTQTRDVKLAKEYWSDYLKD